MTPTPHDLRTHDARRARHGRAILRAILGIMLAMSIGVALLLFTGCHTAHTTGPVPLYALRVKSGSMLPAWRIGDPYYVVPPAERPFTALRVGDVAIYHPAGYGLLMHAVWRINPDGTITTKGTNNAMPDDGTAMTPGNYRGVAVRY